MTGTKKPLVYLMGGHVSGHTVPLAPHIMEAWKRGDLFRVNEDGSTWHGDPFALPGEPGGRIDTADRVNRADERAEVQRPRGNASRTEWAGYAVALGAATEDEAATLTRDELIELTTAPEDRAGT